MVKTPDLNGQKFLLNYEPGMSFERFLEITRAHAEGRDLPPGFVPASFYFAFVDGKIVGRLSFRWELNDFLLKIGGHVGFVVLPEHQRKGYASEMLRQALLLPRARALGRVLLTCDPTNVASIRTLEKAGGLRDDSVLSTKLRYWVEV